MLLGPMLWEDFNNQKTGFVYKNKAFILKIE